MTLEFSKKLYKERALRAGMERFGEFARFRLRKAPKVFRLSISGFSPEHARSLPGEFCNFVLLAGREGA